MNTLHKLKSKYRYSLILLKQLVITEFRLRYKGSVLGYVWTLLRPLALFVILYVVFVNFLKVGADIPHYAVYLLLGVVLWNYFTEVTMNGLTSIVGKGDLFRKLSFPRYTVVIAGSFSALINLGINLIVVTVFILLNGVTLTWGALLIFPFIAELFVFSLGIAFLLSALFVRFRDINYIWEVVLQAGFYATPVLYPISLVVAKSSLIAKLMMLNPAAQVIQNIRYFVVTKDTVTIQNLIHNPFIAAIPFFIVVVLAVFAAWYFKKRSPYFAEEI